MIEFATSHTLNGHGEISQEVMVQFPDWFPYFGERFLSFRVSRFIGTYTDDQINQTKIDEHGI